MAEFTQEEKEYFMREALKEAQKSLAKEEIPIGCVIVKNGDIIGRGHNAREERQKAILHAEIMAIDDANENEGSWRLLDSTLFVTIAAQCGSGLVVRQGAHQLSACFGRKILVENPSVGG